MSVIIDVNQYITELSGDAYINWVRDQACAFPECGRPDKPLHGTILRHEFVLPGGDDPRQITIPSEISRTIT